MKNDRIVLGIDLGTTYSVVSYVDNSGNVQIIRNRDGGQCTPSVVLFDGGATVVGVNAKEQSILNAGNVAQFVKHHMGDPNFRFKTTDGKSYRPEEVSAMILKYLKEDAEAALGRSCEYAVVTVPAYFNDARRKATQDAATLAGLNAIRIINEPTAAALAYSIAGLERPETILVYDLGGGTFDVTIMEASKGELIVKTTDGDNALGGVLWDNALMDHVRAELAKQGGRISDSDKDTLQVLRTNCEKAKIQLSAREKTKVTLTVGGRPYGVEVTRGTFENITRDLVNRTIALTENCLDNAGLTWGTIDKILLVGGSSRLPVVAKELQQLSGKQPSKELDPDLVVSMGAAILGAKTPIPDSTGRELVPLAAQALPAFTITDVCSHSLGTLANNEDGEERNSIILQRDSQLPAKAFSEFSTAVNNQTHLRIRITQGEDEDPQYVQVVGESTISIPAYPKGAPIMIVLGYDVDQIIRVRVTDLTPNPPLDLGEFSIDRTANLAEDEIEALKRRISGISLE